MESPQQGSLDREVQQMLGAQLLEIARLRTLVASLQEQLEKLEAALVRASETKEGA